MRRLKVVFSFLMILGLMAASSLLPSNAVGAAEYYPMSCNAYEVSYINDDGSFKKVACYDDFASANQKMKELGGDHVVRYPTAYSPTHIISMNSGYAYSYPGRGGDATLNVYEDIDDRSIWTKRTYVAHYYQMYYYETSRVLKDGKRGMIRVNLNGFDGYTDLEYCDLVPSKYIDKGIALWLGGQNSYYGEGPYKVLMKRDSYKATQNGNYLDLAFTYHMSYPQSGSIQALEYTLYIGPAPAFMKTNTNYYSKDGIHFYTDPAMTQGAGTEYNYYQFLPLRSKTKLYAANFETFLTESGKRSNSVLAGKAQAFIDAQNTYGVNALLVYAMAVHESAYGTSNYARNRNNLFGWNAFDANPNSASTFPSVEQSINEQMGINLRGYMDITDGRFFNSSLGNKGAGFNVKYASDPYWGMKIAAHAYKIDKTANSFNGKLTDWGVYDLALITGFDIPVKAEANSSSKTLYTTGYGGQYQKDFIVIRLGEVRNYTKIQSTNAITSNQEIITHRTPITTGTVNPISTYDFNLSVAYVETKDLQPLNYTSLGNQNYTHSVSTFAYDGDLLQVSGQAYVAGVELNDKNTISNTLVFRKGEEEKAYPLTCTTTDGVTSFDGKADLSELGEGEYSIQIRTSYSALSQYDSSFDVNAAAPAKRVFNGLQYEFVQKDGKLVLKVTKADTADHEVIKSVSSVRLSGSQLTISGIGVLKGVSFANADQVRYQFVLTDYNTGEKTYSNAAAVENRGFSLGDGFDYTYSAYQGTIDLGSLSAGDYGLELRIESNGVAQTTVLASSKMDYRNLAAKDGAKYYSLRAQDIYNYRFDLKVGSSPLDYTKIKKPSGRPSLISYDSLKIDSSGKVSIDAQAMMYYIDNPSGTSSAYEVYLVSPAGQYKKLDIGTTACKLNFQTAYNLSNDCSGICFLSQGDLTTLSSGRYELVIGIRNGEYHDIVPFTNRSFRKTPDVTVNGVRYHFETEEATARLFLIVG